MKHNLWPRKEAYNPVLEADSMIYATQERWALEEQGTSNKEVSELRFNE